jgi:hypothetical protein
MAGVFINLNLVEDLDFYSPFPRYPATIVFPILTPEYIQSLTMGVYQLKQALPYTIEHINTDGQYLFELFEEELDILHVKIKSRYSSQLVHNIWLSYNPTFIFILFSLKKLIKLNLDK